MHIIRLRHCTLLRIYAAILAVHHVVRECIMISTRIVLLNGLQLVCHPHSVAMFATLPLHARVVLRDVHVLLMLCVHLHVALGLQCVMCINLIQVMFVHLVSVLHHFVILITRQVAYTHIDKVRT